MEDKHKLERLGKVSLEKAVLITYVDTTCKKTLSIEGSVVLQQRLDGTLLAGEAFKKCSQQRVQVGGEGGEWVSSR
jgi:hypothetical protein